MKKIFYSSGGCGYVADVELMGNPAPWRVTHKLHIRDISTTTAIPKFGMYRQEGTLIWSNKD